MKNHLLQASHNERFHECISSNFDSHFHDWRITVLFYVAIHYLKALAVKRNTSIGDTHHEIEQNVNPAKPNALMKITTTAWFNYNSLYRYSRTARYNGITDCNTFEELKKADYQYCLKHIEDFKKYMSSNGVTIE